VTEPPATEPADTAEPAVPATEPAREPSGWSDMSEPAKTGSTKETKEEDLLARTRASQTWIAIIVFALVLILLLIFILQNTKKVEITYLGFTGTMPLAVAMLLSAVAGVLLTATAGTLRILQLRRRVRKSQRT
jgi:putative membrane protein